MVREKDRVNLTCEARGYPEPQILWRREDGKPIMASGMANDKGERMSKTGLIINIRYFQTKTGVCNCGRLC